MTITQLNEIGLRLKQERERLGLNQAEFGESGGVKKNAQSNYEVGERSPSAAYLQRIARIGADVLFILTGRVSAEALTEEEAALLSRFRELDMRGKGAVLGTLAGYDQPHAPSLTINGATIGQVVQGDATGGGTVSVAPDSPNSKKDR